MLKALRELQSRAVLYPLGLLLLVAMFLTSACVQPAADDAATTPDTSTAGAPAPPVTITDLCDNLALRPSLQTDWCFACLVEGFDETVLFDTGNSGDTLLANMEALGVDPQDVDIVVLSHEHEDHIGGLADLLALNPDLTVYCPASFPRSFTSSAEAAGATVVLVDAPVSPCPGVTVTAPLTGDSVDEVGLLLDTSQGLVLMTGCAHPGVGALARAATDRAGRPLFAVLGGFHLYKDPDSQVAAVIDDLQGLGVQECGPAHCTGDAAIAQIQEALGDGFIQMGVGAVVEF